MYVEFPFEPKRVASHYHSNVSDYFNEILLQRWISRKDSTEYPPRSLDIMPQEFFKEDT